MMMNSSSFLKPQVTLVSTLLEKQQFSTFKVHDLVLKSTNSIHKRGFDNSQSSATVYHFENLKDLSSFYNF